MITIILVIWAIGAVCGYVAFKKWITHNGKWTVGLRNAGLLLSLLSWFTLLATIASVFFAWCFDNNKPAKW